MVRARSMDSRNHRLTRWKSAQAAEPRQQIVGLLKSLGVPNRMIYVRGARKNRSFWTRAINHLGVLELARKLYRVQIVYLHPDKPGGSLRRTLELNGLWSRVEKRFKKHGHQLSR